MSKVRWPSGLKHWTGERVVLGSNPAVELWQFRLPRFVSAVAVSFAGDTSLKAVGPFYLVAMPIAYGPMSVE